MELVDKMPNDIKNALMSKAQKALRDAIASRQYAAVLPSHTANMRVEIGDSGNDHIVPIIVPAINIYIDPQGYLDGKIDQSSIGYRLHEGNKPFPLAHVFSDSGYLCLGTIFVPQLVPYHSPQQPLETLFLANDRNMSHGHPVLRVTKAQANAVIDLMRHANREAVLDPQLVNLIRTESNWAVHDVLWQVTNWLLVNACDKQHAMTTAQQIFKMLFNKKEPKHD